MTNQERIEKKFEREFTGFIKVYEYKDPNMGFGEGKTVNILKVKKEWFELTPNGFSSYHMKDKIVKGLNLNLMENGYYFISKDEIKQIFKDNENLIDNLQKLNNQLHILLN